MRDLQMVLKGVLSTEELAFLPFSFYRIGHVAIMSLPSPLISKHVEIANALLQLRGVRTVAIKKGPITGRKRVPTLEIIAGDFQTETLHKENGCLFKMDATRVMFSPGNIYERMRIQKLVKPDEVVVDLFAGIGQFSIPIAKHSKPSKIYAIELNPVAYEYLSENIRINRVGHLVMPIQGDCEIVAPRGIADRVLLGILHIAHHYLPLALDVLKPEGGIIHYHESVPSTLRFERPTKRILDAAAGRKVEILNKRVIKRYAPGVDHVVIDAKISPKITQNNPKQAV